jgi:hypothetical protein
MEELYCYRMMERESFYGCFILDEVYESDVIGLFDWRMDLRFVDYC